MLFCYLGLSKTYLRIIFLQGKRLRKHREERKIMKKECTIQISMGATQDG
jgi:hypothetical protein